MTPTSTPTTTPLSPADLRILDTAHLSRARREWAAAELGLMAVQYHQRLNQLIDDPTALATRPLIVNRLRKVRDLRRTARSRARVTSWQ